LVIKFSLFITKAKNGLVTILLDVDDAYPASVTEILN